MSSPQNSGRGEDVSRTFYWPDILLTELLLGSSSFREAGKEASLVCLHFCWSYFGLTPPPLRLSRVPALSPVVSCFFPFFFFGHLAVFPIPHSVEVPFITSQRDLNVGQGCHVLFVAFSVPQRGSGRFAMWFQDLRTVSTPLHFQTQDLVRLRWYYMAKHSYPL